ncbi:MAG: hypothetical protein K2X73_08425 [Sphingomonas sp.]|uniref:Rossmann fold domain-containing protein n=1 Tax=Sphingomonas sp. TaxID=28214 RepID=UPI00260042EE|nr:hypothetical protein [Sphingomonas sp.]MBX9881985.1 hypothetical protein [Sphingomonas sp.]
MTRIEATADCPALLEAVRAAPGDVVVVLGADLGVLERALASAAIGPLAIERTPARVNAVDCGAGVAAADVEQALAFLEAADCTTGQVLALSARSAPTD